MNILLVEYDKSTQMVYQHYLKKLNYNSTVVEKGMAAVKCITSSSTHPYCAMILDLGLPDISGETVLSVIRDYEAQHNFSRYPLPIIIATAHSDSTQLARCMQKGAQAAFTKPVSFKTLAALLHKLLN